MLPFKPYFLGQEESPFKRVTTCQRCVRVNDLEQVGKTSRHHTFFEMLGNFSFGDYFKEEAIAMAWELLTEKFKLQKEKLWIAVFREDDEAEKIWRKYHQKIVRLDEDNNFWSAGPTGPCGPCSEIYYDFGEELACGPTCKPGCDCERFLEIWNLVFIQYNRDEAGNLNPLPKKNIDTGMGLERIARVLQGVKSNFETDLFKPLISRIESGDKNIIADHVRAMTYLIADGVTPSNEGRGYVLRRIIRRAIVHGGKGLFNICEEVIGRDPFLADQRRFITTIVDGEENNFERTYNSGLELIDKIISENRVTGAEVFKLHDTYGFPFELTREILNAKGFSFDESEFHRKMEEQRERGRKSEPKDQFLKLKQQAQSEFGTSRFVGYDTFESKSKITGILPEENYLLLDATPFYPEGGGQVGDTGEINGVKVLDTLGDINGVIFHKMEHTEQFEIGKMVTAKIDIERRKNISAHHTATHLLQSALRIVVGKEVKQAGSFVGPDRLRFDFNCHRALTREEIFEVEKIVNENIGKKINLNVYCTNFEEAKKRGATALFDQKYGKEVRVVEITDVSLELCGGAHAKSTADLKKFKIIKESAVQAGVRRIEAVVSSAADEFLKQSVLQEKELREKEKSKAQDKVQAQVRIEKARQSGDQVIREIKEIKGIQVAAHEAEGLDLPALRILGDRVKDQLKSGIILLASSFEGKAFFLAIVSDDLVAKGCDAGKLVKLMAQTAGGGGGGRANKAEAGGKDPTKIKEALSKAIDSL